MSRVVRLATKVPALMVRVRSCDHCGNMVPTLEFIQSSDFAFNAVTEPINFFRQGCLILFNKLLSLGLGYLHNQVSQVHPHFVRVFEAAAGHFPQSSAVFVAPAVKVNHLLTI
eukprot:m.184138 g.184138  ORF g.184138 m.184138 type:complete len:113 (-) comp18094_c0_seq2:3112-3450(-)